MDKWIKVFLTQHDHNEGIDLGETDRSVKSVDNMWISRGEIVDRTGGGEVVHELWIECGKLSTEDVVGVG